MILSKCAICGSKRSKFIKKQEAKGILTSPGFKTGLDKIPFIGDLSATPLDALILSVII